jgi:integrase
MKKIPPLQLTPQIARSWNLRKRFSAAGAELPKWSNGRSRKNRATVRQKKTGQPVKFEMTEQTREAIDNYLAAAGKKPGEFIFGGRRGRDRPITTRQYARLVGQWIAGIGLDPRFFGTHSLRRTKATLIYRRTGNLRAVQLLLGH